MLGNVYIRNYTISSACIYLTQFDNTWNLLNFIVEGKKILIYMLYWNVYHHVHVITYICTYVHTYMRYIWANLYRFSVCIQTYIACVKSSSICVWFNHLYFVWFCIALES